jgi:hypothetical protein
VKVSSHFEDEMMRVFQVGRPGTLCTLKRYEIEETARLFLLSIGCGLDDTFARKRECFVARACPEPIVTKLKGLLAGLDVIGKVFVQLVETLHLSFSHLLFSRPRVVHGGY